MPKLEDFKQENTAYNIGGKEYLRKGNNIYEIICPKIIRIPKNKK